jgi:hypothetical protein
MMMTTTTTTVMKYQHFLPRARACVKVKAIPVTDHGRVRVV